MTPAQTLVQRPAESTNPSRALFNVLVTLALFVVSFIGFLIAPWIVLGVAALIYAVRVGRKSERKSDDGEHDGAIQGFGLGGGLQ
ncbi:MAG: hypothetical protein JWQ74_1770 [Marmoricola sp.]|nr:hypothetical protein [Marmoricola sp.]